VFIDLSQYEAGVQFLSGAFVDYSATGAVAHREGNRDPGAAPHGCYLCLEGRWCAISCWDEEEWASFCKAAEKPSWIMDPRFDSLASRKKHEAELNRLVAGWTRDKDASWIMHLFSDPQITFRQIWQSKEHPEIGPQHYRMVSYQLEDTPGRIRGPAPCLGEHNAEVFQSLLGLPPEEQQRLLENGALT
jgi:crotonobetainyl-CoA:carnitine CoA-transferase CaiB-like acyl-CoA transferase